MVSRRLLAQRLAQASRTASSPRLALYTTAPLRTIPSASRRGASVLPTRPFSSTPLQRDSSASASSSDKQWDFKALSSAVEQPSASRILVVDVREPAELEASGRIPGAVNLPIKSGADGFFLPADEFEHRFGFEKPAAEAELVFYCKAGVRSRMAATLARQVGYQNVGEYPGSWDDWVEKGGQVEK